MYSLLFFFNISPALTFKHSFLELEAMVNPPYAMASATVYPSGLLPKYRFTLFIPSNNKLIFDSGQDG
jgi:hypothetical protein